SDSEMILSNSGANWSILLTAWVQTPRAVVRPVAATANPKTSRREKPFCAPMVAPSSQGRIFNRPPNAGRYYTRAAAASRDFIADIAARNRHGVPVSLTASAVSLNLCLWKLQARDG